MMKRNGAIICVLAAAVLWGCMGLFVRQLNANGLGALGIVQLRITTGLIFVGLYLLFFGREKFRIRFKDIWCFAGTGICSLLFFTWCYFTGMEKESLSVMSILLYTAPAFVMTLSIIFFKEKLTRAKLTALLMTFAGCVLVAGIGTDMRVSGTGILLGLGAGFGYALYSIFGRFAIDRGYDSWTITFYTFAFCAAGCTFLTDWAEVGTALAANGSIWMWIILMGFTTGFLAYVLYTKGLQGIESSRASILASVEPVVATIVGVAVFHEPMTILQAVGIALVFGGIVVLSVKAENREN